MLLYQSWINWIHMYDERVCDLEVLESIADLNYQEHEPDAEEKMDTEKLCQHASVSFALATIEKRNTDYPYGEHFRELVENAKRDLLRFRQVSRVKAGLPEAERLKMEEQELDLFEGTVYLELFRLRMADGNYEEALRLLARCMALLGAAAPADRGWFKPAPPIRDLQADEATACFERLSTEPTRVKNWKDVALSCRMVYVTWDSCGLDSSEWVHEDEEGLNWTAGEYWASAVAIGESELTPSQLRDLRREEEREHAEKHMRVFFGEDCWERLPDVAKETLKDAEDAWLSATLSRKSGVVIHLWKAAGQIIRENLSGQFVEYVSSQPVKELATLKVINLADDPFWVPGLDDFIRLMWKHPRF